MAVVGSVKAKWLLQNKVLQYKYGQTETESLYFFCNLRYWFMKFNTDRSETANK